MKSILFLTAIFGSCTAKEVKATHDFIEGEVKTAEQVVEDLTAIKPSSAGKINSSVEARFPVIKF